MIECSKLAQSKYKTRNDWGGEGDPLIIVQEVYVWLCKQMVYAQPRIYPGERDSQNSVGFCDTNGSSNLRQTTKPRDSQQKKKKKKKKRKKRKKGKIGKKRESSE